MANAHQIARDRAKAAIDAAPDGNVVVVSGELCITPPIDGYCPFVCGMMKKAD